jgi:two-component system OmpR family response regulator
MPGPKIFVIDDNNELANLLAKLLEDAGYSAFCFPRGKPAIEKLRQEKPALAIIDVLLPDVMGYEVAAVCQKELKIPVVFITGVFKGGRNALDAKAKYDALAYFEKPFEAQKLLDVVMGAVKPVRGPPVQEPPRVSELDIEIDLDEEEAGRDPLELTGRVSLREDDGLSATLQGKTLTAAAPVRPPSSPGFSLPTALRSEAGRSGALKDNLPSLITAFYLTQKSGELLLTKGKVRKAVNFEQGRPVFAMSNVASDRFGYFLYRVGKISEAQLNEVLEKTRASRRRTGEILMEMGLLKEAERLYYVGQQVKSIIYSLFAWEEGAYQISFQDRVVEQAIKLDLQPATLIVRGVKKLYRPERLQRLIAPGDRLRPTQDPPYQLSELSLEPWEAALYSNLNSETTMQRIIAQAKRPEGAVRASMVALLALHMIEKA